MISTTFHKKKMITLIFFGVEMCGNALFVQITIVSRKNQKKKKSENIEKKLLKKAKKRIFLDKNDTTFFSQNQGCRCCKKIWKNNISPCLNILILSRTLKFSLVLVAFETKTQKIFLQLCRSQQILYKNQLSSIKIKEIQPRF